jgi:hypothetical protein
MNINVDPLIKQEFDRLGFNVIENEHLADLIIEKVKNRRKKMIGLITLAVAGATALLALIYFAASSSSSEASAPVYGTSLTQAKSADGGQKLPLAGYIDVNGETPEGSRAVFPFKLEASQMLQLITDNPDPIRGIAGEIEVYLVGNGMENRLIQTYDMGSGTHINEFGVPQSGGFRWVLTFNNPNFKGRVRYAFVRTN